LYVFTKRLLISLFSSLAVLSRSGGCSTDAPGLYRRTCTYICSRLVVTVTKYPLAHSPLPKLIFSTSSLALTAKIFTVCSASADAISAEVFSRWSANTNAFVFWTFNSVPILTLFAPNNLYYISRRKLLYFIIQFHIVICASSDKRLAPTSCCLRNIKFVCVNISAHLSQTSLIAASISALLWPFFVPTIIEGGVGSAPFVGRHKCRQFGILFTYSLFAG